MYETVSVKAVRAFYTAGCRLFFQDQTGTKYVWNRVKHVCCLMWFGIKKNPKEYKSMHETACQAWFSMIKGEAFTLRLLSRFEHIIMFIACSLYKAKEMRALRIINLVPYI